MIDDFLRAVDAPYRAMAQAGFVLLAAAADGVGPQLADDASAAEEEQEIQARIYHAAYTQGRREGVETGTRLAVELIRQKIAARQTAA